MLNWPRAWYQPPLRLSYSPCSLPPYCQSGLLYSPRPQWGELRDRQSCQAWNGSVRIFYYLSVPRRCAPSFISWCLGNSLPLCVIFLPFFIVFLALLNKNWGNLRFTLKASMMVTLESEHLRIKVKPFSSYEVEFEKSSEKLK